MGDFERMRRTTGKGRWAKFPKMGSCPPPGQYITNQTQDALFASGV